VIGHEAGVIYHH